MMKLKSAYSFVLLAYLLLGLAGSLYAQEETIILWPNGMPNAIVNSDYYEIAVINDGQLTSVSKVTIPTLSVFAIYSKTARHDTELQYSTPIFWNLKLNKGIIQLSITPS